MTTRPYEMMDQSPHELEQVIRQFPDTVKSLADDVLTAMLAWSQANQDATVHRPCWEESFRRDAGNHATLDERMNEVRHTESALKARTAVWGPGPDGEMTDHESPAPDPWDALLSDLPRTQEQQRDHDQRAADLADAKQTALELIDRIRNGHDGRIGHAELMVGEWLDRHPDRTAEHVINLCVELALRAA